MIFLFFFAAVIFSPATEMADQGWPSGLFIELQRELERDEYAPEALEQGPVAIKGSADPPFFFFFFLPKWYDVRGAARITVHNDYDYFAKQDGLLR